MCSSAAATDLVAFRFTASLFAEADLFGHTIGPGDAVSGHVIYRTDASVTPARAGCDDCKAYAMDLLNGFAIEVGPLSLRYDSYTANVVNDGPGLSPDTLEDVLSFPSNSSGPTSYQRELLVNGVPAATGTMDLSLVAGASLLDSAQLPADPQPGDFSIGNVLIGDGPNVVFGFVDFGSLQRFSVPDGDFFLDGAVSPLDYNAWVADYGSAFASSADANRDGLVDAADYTIWRDQLAPPPFTVPEPGGAAGALVMAALALAGRRAPADDRT